MRSRLLLPFLWPFAVEAQNCTLTLSILTEAAHGALEEGSALSAEVTYRPDRRMRMGSESTAHFTEGTMKISGPDGTSLTGKLKVIHVVRAPHWADYMSFDVVDVIGDLGGVEDYQDPMLLSFYAARGETASFDLPTTQAAFDQYNRRRFFQVHTPDTMWTLPGTILDPVIACDQ